MDSQKSVVVLIGTFNAQPAGRLDLLRRTVLSAVAAFPGATTFVVDNASDGGAPWLDAAWLPASVRVVRMPSEDGNRTVGRLLTKRIETFRRWCADEGVRPQDVIVVLSDDDIEWKEGVEAELRSVWARAPMNLRIVSGLLEPAYPHNGVLERWRVAGIDLLVRRTVPMAAWTLRGEDLVGLSFVENNDVDYPLCVSLVGAGHLLAAADWAQHLGGGLSLIGNRHRPGKEQARRWPIARIIL